MVVGELVESGKPRSAGAEDGLQPDPQIPSGDVLTGGVAAKTQLLFG